MGTFHTGRRTLGHLLHGPKDAESTRGHPRWMSSGCVHVHVARCLFVNTEVFFILEMTERRRAWGRDGARHPTRATNHLTPPPTGTHVHLMSRENIVLMPYAIPHTTSTAPATSGSCIFGIVEQNEQGGRASTLNFNFLHVSNYMYIFDCACRCLR